MPRIYNSSKQREHPRGSIEDKGEVMENREQMRKRHEAEIEALEKNCLHVKLSKWKDYSWAPGHLSGRVKVCKNCGKIIKRDKRPGPDSSTIKEGGKWKYLIVTTAT